ncbi:MAG: patatin-like phospholipase family protein [Thermoanaerobaculia bacterium]
MTSRKRVALVIGSGSVKCAAALGLQRVFAAEGIGIDLVVGCSGGSIYAALLAGGLDVETAIEMTRRLWTREVTRKRHTPSLVRALLPRVFGFSQDFGLKDDRLILRRLRDAYGDKKIEDMETPLFLTATDFHTGEQVVMSRGSVVDALRASIAIPFIFRPWPVDGRLLIDGFMSDPLPVGVAMREGANVIVAMGFESPYQTSVDSAARFAFQLSSIMTNNLLRSNFAFHSMAHHAEVIPIIPTFSERIGLFATSKIPLIIEEGERAALEQVPYLRKILSSE